MARVLIGVVAIAFVSVSLVLIKPVSDGGRLARKLCIANAVGWLLILPLGNAGHPPTFLIPAILFWLVNLVLLPAAASALWSSHKERVEGVAFLAVTTTYTFVNLAILFVVPSVWLLMEASSSY